MGPVIARDHAAMAAQFRGFKTDFESSENALTVRVDDPVDRYALATIILSEPFTVARGHGVERFLGFSRASESTLVSVYGAYRPS